MGSKVYFSSGARQIPLTPVAAKIWEASFSAALISAKALWIEVVKSNTRIKKEFF